MQLKYLLGVFIPLILILVIGFISQSGIGLRVSYSHPSVLLKQEVNPVPVSGDRCENRDWVKVLTIRYENDFFMGKVVDVPWLVACAYSCENSTGVLRCKGKRIGSYRTVLDPNMETFKEHLGVGYYSKRKLELPAHQAVEIHYSIRNLCDTRRDNTIDVVKEYRDDRHYYEKARLTHIGVIPAEQVKHVFEDEYFHSWDPELCTAIGLNIERYPGLVLIPVVD
ncbi:hypothetical protein J7L02_02700 [Candidatus Woesearchaeota archaeon]|nr:hypothetical protein [Candidatus Woesearchaeota archaeon]